MAATRTLLTADEFFRLPEADGKQELVRGEVVEMPPVGGQHGDAQTELAMLMRSYARRGKLGHVVVEVGFRLATDPDLVRAPDVAFVSFARLPEGQLPARYLDGAPDLAVEVLSPDDRIVEVEEKVQEYLAAGTRLVWTLNPRTRSVTVYYPDGSSRTLRGDDRLSGEDVLPGFEVRVGDLFAG